MESKLVPGPRLAWGESAASPSALGLGKVSVPVQMFQMKRLACRGVGRVKESNKWQPATRNSGWKKPSPRLNEGEEIALLEPGGEAATEGGFHRKKCGRRCVPGRSPPLCMCSGSELAWGRKGSRVWVGD